MGDSVGTREGVAVGLTEGEGDGLGVGASVDDKRSGETKPVYNGRPWSIIVAVGTVLIFELGIRITSEMFETRVLEPFR